MGFLIDPFVDSSLMREALVAGLLAVVTCSLVGTWVVLRGMSFMGDALAHGVLPGIAVAFLLGVNTTVGALFGAAVMMGGVGLVSRRTRLGEDTAIGLLFVGMLALGVIIVSRAGSFANDLTGFLFGSAAGIDLVDLQVQAAAAVVVIVGVTVLYRSFLVLSFNPQKAALLGLRPRLAHAVLLALVALAIVASFRAVGTLLVFGLLVAPPAAAALLVRRVPTMMLTSVGFGAVAVVAGLLMSWYWRTAIGASMAGMAVLLFFVVLAITELRAALHRRQEGSPAGPSGPSAALGG